jgi:hypothetical protein
LQQWKSFLFHSLYIVFKNPCQKLIFACDSRYISPQNQPLKTYYYHYYSSSRIFFSCRLFYQLFMTDGFFTCNNEARLLWYCALFECPSTYTQDLHMFSHIEPYFRFCVFPPLLVPVNRLLLSTKMRSSNWVNFSSVSNCVSSHMQKIERGGSQFRVCVHVEGVVLVSRRQYLF